MTTTSSVVCGAWLGAWVIVLTGNTVVTGECDLAGQLVTSGPQLVTVRTSVEDTTEVTVSGPPNVVGDEFSDVCEGEDAVVVGDVFSEVWGWEVVVAGRELLVRG